MKLKFKEKDKKGITLIALVITIIIILIISAVSIRMLGRNGIIAQAKWSAYVTEYESVDEAVKLHIYENAIEKYTEEKKETKQYPIAEKVQEKDISQTLKATIMKLENVEESEINNNQKVDLYKVDFTKLNIDLNVKKQYTINIVTGMVYSIEYEKYKGNYYHTPRLGINSKGEYEEEIPEEEAINIHYKLGEEEIYTQNVNKDAKVAKLESSSNMKLTKTLMYWKDVTEVNLEGDNENIEDEETEEEISGEGLEDISEDNAIEENETEEDIIIYSDEEEIVIEGTDIYLEAVCGQESITLYTNGGQFENGETEKTWAVTNGEMYGEMPDPTNENNDIFVGWFTDATNGEQITKEDVYNGNITKLYAQWTNSDIITVKYNVIDTNATCSIKEKKIKLNAKIGNLPTSKQTKKETYKFDRWIDKNGNKITSKTKVTEDMLDERTLNLYARFTIHMNYDFRGGTTKLKVHYKNVKIGGTIGTINTRCKKG